MIAGAMGTVSQIPAIQIFVFSSLIVAVDPVAVSTYYFWFIFQLEIKWFDLRQVLFKLYGKAWKLKSMFYICTILWKREGKTCYDCLINSFIGQVLAVFTEVGINPTLYFLVFGESLLNGLSCIYRLSEVKLKEHLYFQVEKSKIFTQQCNSILNCSEMR